VKREMKMKSQNEYNNWYSGWTKDLLESDGGWGKKWVKD